MSTAVTTSAPLPADHNGSAEVKIAATSSNNKNNFASSISPARQKTREQKIEAEKVFFNHCSTTYKAEFDYFNTMQEPAVNAISHVRERETVFRNYVEKDRNLDFGFLAEDFYDGREQIELIEEEVMRRKQIEDEALADEDEKLTDLVSSGAKQAGIKTQIRLCQAEEHAERSKILWEMQKSVRRLSEEGNKEFLVHHHKETCRVNDGKKELFFGIPGATLLSQNQNSNPGQQKTASQLVREELEEEKEREKQKQQQQNVSSPNNNTNNVLSSGNSTSLTKTDNNNKGIISSSVVPNFPAVPEVDFTFLEESEAKIREVIERTGLQELRSSARALQAFQVDALNDIEIMRLKKQETLRRSYIIGFAFRYFLLMLQEKESAVREDSIGLLERQHRTQIDVVENRCWLKSKEHETWRNDRERTFAVAEERKQREQQWQKERLDEEDRKNFIRSELQSRVENSREEHYERSIIQEQFDREFHFLRRQEIASLVENEVSANTLHWNEEFHAQIVVSERQKRRQLVAEESSERSEVLSQEVRDYIQTRRDELFDKDTSDAMKYIDQVRDRGDGGELNAYTLPTKMSSSGVLVPRPPPPPPQQQQVATNSSSSSSPSREPVITYQRGTAGGSRPSSTPHGNSTTATGASLRAPKV